MLRNNLGYKLAAFAIALTIWAYSNAAQNSRISREIKDVPLTVQNVEPGCSATVASRMVSITLEGERKDVNAAIAQLDGTGAYVNLQGRRAGAHTLPVLVRIPTGLAGLVTAQTSPREAKVTLRERSQRSLDVQAQFTVSPPAGSEFGPVELSPVKVTVSGPSERVRQVAKVVAMVGRNGSEAEGVQGDFAVYALDRNGKYVPEVALSPDKVRVSAEVLEVPASRLAFVSLSIKGQPPFPHRVAEIEIHPQTVTVTGKPAQLTGLTTLKTETLDLSSRTSTFTKRVSIIVPEGLSLPGDQSVRATVRIEKAVEPESPSEPPAED